MRTTKLEEASGFCWGRTRVIGSHYFEENVIQWKRQILEAGGMGQWLNLLMAILAAPGLDTWMLSHSSSKVQLIEKLTGERESPPKKTNDQFLTTLKDEE